ncbi:MAG: cobalamin-binding protein [Thermoplasmata archaeon]|nr:cobalamin-binding protein [Thermoplasmata archaeon]
MRIVSLLPSATEIVCTLGAGSELVGRSAECDYPELVRALPVVMRAKVLDAAHASHEIDARVRATRGAGEGLYSLDLALLQQLRPDVVLTQDLCAVCSVTDAEVQRACESVGVSPRIASFSPQRLSDVWDSVGGIGDAIGRRAAGTLLTEALRSFELRYRRRAIRNTARPRVAIVEWLDPPILAGLWTPDLVAAAGGASIGPAPGGRAQTTSWSALALQKPDLLVLSPCSFSVRRTLQELGTPSLAGALDALAPGLGCWIADEAFFSRPGPRLAKGIELVGSLLDASPSAPPTDLQRWIPEEVLA